MEYEKTKFLLELQNYFSNLPEYSINEVIYSYARLYPDLKTLRESDDTDAVKTLERAQNFENGI